MTVPLPATRGLLSADDPPPVERLNARGRASIVLACEHAGRAVPRRLSGAAPRADAMERHIAYDIGAETVARHLAARLDAPLVVQRYSRLVIDCNRPLGAPDLAPAIADGTEVGFNNDLDGSALDARWAEIHQPFHDALADTLDQRPNAALVTIHSFTPRLNGFDRPWHIGFLARRDLSLSRALMGHVVKARPETVAALNQPYQIEDASDYTIPVHGEGRELPHVLIEIRNDLIGDANSAATWADLVAAGLRQWMPA